MEPKPDEFWIVRLNGCAAEVVRTGGSDLTRKGRNVVEYIYGCGDEEGWDLSRSDLQVTWVRRVRMPRP